MWLTTLEYPEVPLLAIQVKPVQGQYFPTRRPTNAWSQWHLSLCFKSDPHTVHDLAYLVRKFDDRVFRLVLNHTEWPTGSSLELDTARDPLASDRVVQRLHRNGYYGNKALHISA